MRIAAIVPVHRFVRLTGQICSWCQESYPRLFADYRVFVICDDPNSALVLAGLQQDKIEVLTSPTRDSLKSSLIFGQNLAMRFGADVINVIEADAIPSFATLHAMAEAYLKLPAAGAISPMYAWHGEICYPTHPHWYTDALVDASFPQLGEVREPGECGIPFLFSLWNPAALGLISRNQSTLPHVYGLDGDLGRLVAEQGLRFYRLIDYTAGHFNGGFNG